MSENKKINVALVGQPNVGKSHLINAVTGATLHVGNFAGVTVEKKEVTFERNGYEIDIVDLPGVYSLNAYSPEEDVTKRSLLDESYDVIVNVVDAGALQRNLALTLQLLDMGKKMIVAVNMIDEVEKNGGSVDAEKMQRLLGVPVLLVSAKEGRGVEELAQSIVATHDQEYRPAKLYYDQKIEEAVERLSTILATDTALKNRARFLTLRLLENDRDAYRLVHDRPVFMGFQEQFFLACENLRTLFDEESTAALLSDARVALARGVVSETLSIPHKDTLTERIDKLLIHPLLGLPIFLFFLWALFSLTFTLGQIPMELIETVFSSISDLMTQKLPQSTVRDAFAYGVIPAVGSVVMFLPNILILFLGINLLEQTGYMARAAFLLDGFMKRFGLHGKAFIPLVTGFGCSVPAYMAARTLKNPKDRLITLLVIGFFSCSARLPVYVLFIGAFFTATAAGNVLFIIYITGALLGMVAAKVLRLALFRGEAEPFVMEMPKYRMPSFKAVIRDLKIKAWMFIKKAGLFIAAASMVISFLSSFPQNEQLSKEYDLKMSTTTTAEQNSTLQLQLHAAKLENSYIGILGKTIEPIFEPLGFDWKMSVATISALAAKEVAVGTLATLHAEPTQDDDTHSLVQKLRESIDIKAALAFIVLIMVYSPCIAAMSTFFAEVGEWRWRVLYLAYPNITAWLLAFITYNIVGLLGW